MTEYIKGDLLTTDAPIICHQVNLQGVMGGGLAYAIAIKYPKVNEKYREYIYKELGRVCYADADDFIVANCFSQEENFDTNYYALRECLIDVNESMNTFNLDTVAIPYKYGCGIANGDWNIVLSIFEEVFADKKLLIYIKE